MVLRNVSAVSATVRGASPRLSQSLRRTTKRTLILLQSRLGFPNQGTRSFRRGGKATPRTQLDRYIRGTGGGALVDEKNGVCDARRTSRFRPSKGSHEQRCERPHQERRETR